MDKKTLLPISSINIITEIQNLFNEIENIDPIHNVEDIKLIQKYKRLQSFKQNLIDFIYDSHKLNAFLNESSEKINLTLKKCTKEFDNIFLHALTIIEKNFSCQEIVDCINQLKKSIQLKENDEIYENMIQKHYNIHVYLYKYNSLFELILSNPSFLKQKNQVLQFQKQIENDLMQAIQPIDNLLSLRSILFQIKENENNIRNNYLDLMIKKELPQYTKNILSEIYNSQLDEDQL